MVTQFVRDFRRIHGTPDKETVERLIRQVRASLRPRNYRGPDPDTSRAANMRLAGQNWSQIYEEFYGRYWKAQVDKRRKLRRNTNAYLKRMKVQDGFPKAMSVPEWLVVRQKSQKDTLTV